MAISKAIGSDDVVETGLTSESSDKESITVVVEGTYAAVKAADPDDYVPDGYTLESSVVASNGDGTGKLSIRCLKYDSGDASAFSPVRTTFRVDMEEVQYDLEDHPYLAEGRDQILKWLATDEADRVKEDTFKYKDESGELKEITDDSAIKFCKAYMAGIKTFNRYYPVIEKISIWKNPPGLTRSGKTFTGGSPTFSDGIGNYDSPPLTLSGYPETNWFKSKDSWVESENKTWTRTEQWTYTPEGSSGDNAWIYKNL